MINLTDQMIYRLSGLNKENSRISYQMSTGKVLERGSDDSKIYARELYINDKINLYEGLETQIDKTEAYNTVSDSTMSEIKMSIESIKADVLKSLSSGMDPSDKEAVAVNINGLKENLLTLANTSVDGEFVFAGSNTTIRAFVKDEDTGKVFFNGDAMLRSIAVEANTYRDRGIHGFDALMYTRDEAGASATTGNNLTFEAGERLIDDNGNEWHLTKALAGDRLTFNISEGSSQIVDDEGVTWALTKADVGTKLTFDVDDSTNSEIKDDNGNIWKINGVNLENQSDTSKTIPITNIAGDIWQTTSVIPNNLGIESLSIGELKIRRMESNNLTSTQEISVTHVQGDQYRTDLISGVLNDGSTAISYMGIDSDGDTQVDDDLKVRKTDINGNFPSGKESTIHTLTAASGVEPEKYTFNVHSDVSLMESKHNFFNDIDVIVNALETDTNEDSGTTIGLRSTLDMIESQYNSSNVGHSILGARNKIFENALDSISSKITHYSILYQEVAGADLSKVAMEAKSLEMQYTALYSTISKMHELTLVNFVR